MRMKSELLTDRLAIRGRERNEENGVRFADIGGTVPNIRLDCDSIAFAQVRFLILCDRMPDSPLNHDQDFTAVRMVMAAIGSARL
jgi:hypothetical protein